MAASKTSHRIGGRMPLVRSLIAAVAGCAALACAAQPAQAAFGIANVDGSVADQAGGAYTQAGGHPYSATVVLDVNQDGNGVPEGGGIKNVTAKLPAGFIGNPTAVPACSKALAVPSGQQAASEGQDQNTFCPRSSIIGIATVKIATGSTIAAPVFNLEPPPGVPAEFAFSYLNQQVTLDAELRSDGDYGLNVKGRNLNQVLQVLSSSVTIWGVPADHAHDSQRCFAFIFNLEQSPAQCLDVEGFPLVSGGPAGIPVRAFLTNPTSCPGPGIGLETRVAIDSWDPAGGSDEEGFVSHLPPVSDPFAFTSLPPDQRGAPQGPTGCDRVPFDPAIETRLDSDKADAPTGLAVDITFPQDGLDNPTGIATAHLRRAKVTLPEGMTISPSGANGLQSCSDPQLATGSKADVQCPAASKIGTVEASTPLLAETLSGGIYVGSQKSFDPESGDLFRIFLVLENKQRGVQVKLAGKIRANAATGRLETTFDNNPQVPVSAIRLRFNSGARAALATPPSCGPKTIDAEFQSWSGATVTRSDTVDIACPGVTGFSPTFSAGTIDPLGGAFSPFTLRIDRNDNQQYLAGVKVELPQGLLAKLKGVPLCADAQASAGTCAAGSRVGSATVGAGPGTSPFFLTGQPVYLTGPYKGAPYGLSVVTRAIAGPFDLGTVVVRQRLEVDPTDAHVTVVSDPLPVIVKGVPLRLRTVDVDVDRPGFIFNPTSCAKKQIKATLGSTGGAISVSAQRFQSAECRSLAFSPKLAFRLTGKGQTRGGKHPGLKSVLTQPSKQANMKQVKIALPLSLALDPDNADGLCEYAEGQKVDPKCPKGSIVGSAVARTPVLNQPLRGPVYFVKGVRFGKNGRPIRTLPTLLVALRGEVALNVRATTSVSREGKLVTTFPVVPDAPVSRFDLSLKGGSKGILTVSQGRLCGAKQVSAAQFDAHNGKRVSRGVTMKTPCGSAKKRK